MRIGIVSPVYPPYRGGMGVVTQREARALKKRGADVEVFSPTLREEGSPEDAFVTSIQPFWHNGHTAIMPQVFWRLRDVDVIYLHYPFYGAEICALMAAWIWRKPLVLRYHMQARVRGWRFMVFHVHRWCIEPFVIATAKKILVSSFDYAESIGLKGKKVQELPFGIDTKQFVPPEKKEAGQALRFLFVGGMDRPHYFKGIPDLLKAVATLPKGRWKLTLVGDGSLRASYESLAKTFGIEEDVTFLGSLAHDALVKQFQTADVHVLPSTNQSEAFGLVTLEAGACGCASIVSDLPGVRTLVEEGKTGYIIKPGHVGSLSSALMRCLEDPEAVRSMGHSARARVEHRYDDQRLLDTLYDTLSHLS